MGCVGFWTSTNFGLAMTEYHRLVAQKQHTWFLTVLEAGEARIRAATQCREPTSWSAAMVSRLCPPAVGVREVSAVFFQKQWSHPPGSTLGTSSPPRGPASRFHHIGQNNNAQREECTIRLFLSTLISNDILNLSSRNVRFTNFWAIYML